jgi:hypothetical protein
MVPQLKLGFYNRWLNGGEGQGAIDRRYIVVAVVNAILTAGVLGTRKTAELA